MHFISVCKSLISVISPRRGERGAASNPRPPEAPAPPNTGSAPAPERLSKVVLARGREPARGGERRLSQ